jgi:hypothetical protein
VPLNVGPVPTFGFTSSAPRKSLHAGDALLLHGLSCGCDASHAVIRRDASARVASFFPARSIVSTIVARNTYGKPSTSLIKDSSSLTDDAKLDDSDDEASGSDAMSQTEDRISSAIPYCVIKDDALGVVRHQ